MLGHLTVHGSSSINDKQGYCSPIPFCRLVIPKLTNGPVDGTDPDELKTLTVHGYPAAYSADLDRYQPMCRKCHRGKDAEKRDGKE